VINSFSAGDESLQNLVCILIHTIVFGPEGMPRPREFKPDEVLDSAMQQFWERVPGDLGR
jgi:hypothetical protein